MRTDDWRWQIVLGAAGNLLFVLVPLVVWWVFRSRRRSRLAKFLGASAWYPDVEVVVSNLDSPVFAGDGTLHRGHEGAAVGADEFAAAMALKDAVAKTRLLFFDRLASLHLAGIRVHVRPSRAHVDEEAQQEFIADKPHGWHCRSVVLIGSPAYNKATVDVIGPAVDVTCCGPFDAGTRSTSPLSEVLQRMAMANWVRERTALSWETLRRPEGTPYPMGLRRFTLYGGHVDQDESFAGRDHVAEDSQEQVLIHQVRLGPDDHDLRHEGLTITVICGLSGHATAAGVKQLIWGRRLPGRRSWNAAAVRRRILGQARRELPGRSGRDSPWWWRPRQLPRAWALAWSYSRVRASPEISFDDRRPGVVPTGAASVVRDWSRDGVVRESLPARRPPTAPTPTAPVSPAGGALGGRVTDVPACLDALTEAHPADADLQKAREAYGLWVSPRSGPSHHFGTCHDALLGLARKHDGNPDFWRALAILHREAGQAAAEDGPMRDLYYARMHLDVGLYVAEQMGVRDPGNVHVEGLVEGLRARLEEVVLELEAEPRGASARSTQ